MRKFIVMMAAALSVSAATVAMAEDKVTGTVYAGPVSKYLFRGIDLSENRGVIQGGVDLGYKGFTLSYWTNYQTITGPSGNPATEAGNASENDLTLNYSFTPAPIVTFNVGNTFYMLDGAEDTNEVYLKTTLNTLLSPTFAVYYDWDVAEKAGVFMSLGVGHTVELAKNLGLSLGALASYNAANPSASAAYHNFHNYELTASLDYAVTDTFKISPNYLYSNAFNSTARHLGNITDQSVVGLKAALSF